MLTRFALTLAAALGSVAAAASPDSLAATSGHGADSPSLLTEAMEWRQILPPGPLRRQPGFTALDASAPRLIVGFGAGPSQYFADVWAYALSGPGGWSHLACRGAPPPARAAAAAIHDAAAHRVVLFGGVRGNVPLNDLWVLSLADPPVWTSIVPSGLPPTPRWNASAIFDPLRNRMIVFGGETALGKSAETWVLTLEGTPAWRLLAPGSGPSPRALASMAYDSARDRVVIHGGQGVVNEFDDDTWALDLATEQWAALGWAGTHPGRQDGASLSYDAAHDRLILFGGNTGQYGDNHRLDAMWRLDLANPTEWTEVVPLGARPAARFVHGTALDADRSRLLLFGGVGDSALGDLWALQLETLPEWQPLAAEVAWPEGTPQAAVHDTRRDRMLVIENRGETLLEFPLGAPARWRRIPTQGGPLGGASGYSAILDPDNDRVVLFSGYAFPYPDEQTWELTLADPPTWRRLMPAGTPPSNRDFASALYDPARRRMLVFGGEFDADRWYSDVHALNLDGAPAWETILPAGTLPEGRSGAIAIYDPVRDRMVVSSGRAEPWPWPVDTWSLHLADPAAWELFATSAGRPTGHSHGIGFYDGGADRLLVRPGFPDPVGVSSPDVFALDLGSGQWQTCVVAGAPPAPRGAALAVFDATRRRMLMWGGRGADGRYVELWELALDTPTPVTSSLAEARVEQGTVSLAWWFTGPEGFATTIERQAESTGWQPLGRPSVDGTRRLIFVDPSVLPGHRYRYRLAWLEEGTARSSETGWLDVPLAPAFALRGALPNPATDVLRVAFSLPAAGEASLTLTDLAGRRVARSEVGSLGPGEHRVVMSVPTGLPPGVYWVTLRQGAEAVTMRAAIAR